MDYFSALPTEVIIFVFSHLGLADILKVQRINRFFHSIVQSSVHLQYLTQLFTAGLLDNPECTLSVAEKFALLEKREAAWDTLDVQARWKVALPHTPTGIYDLAEGVIIDYLRVLSI